MMLAGFALSSPPDGEMMHKYRGPGRAPWGPTLYPRADSVLTRHVDEAGPTALQPAGAALDTALSIDAAMTGAKHTANAINERFNNDPDDVKGYKDVVLLHQWDEWDHWQTPWKMCDPAPNNAAGCDEKRRVRNSGSIIFKGLKEKVSPEQIPLFSFEGGIIYKPSLNKVNCLYGVDAGTDYGGSTSKGTDGSCFPPGKGGCIPGCGMGEFIPWCNATNPVNDHDCLCGFAYCNGRPQPWHPEDVRQLMGNQKVRGTGYSFGGFNGYNEAIVDATAKDKHLPESIEAFFWVEGCDGQGVLGKACTGKDGARRVHQAFLNMYGHKAVNVPLLVLRPTNWDQPFAVDEHAATSPVRNEKPAAQDDEGVGAGADDDDGSCTQCDGENGGNNCCNAGGSWYGLCPEQHSWEAGNAACLKLLGKDPAAKPVKGNIAPEDAPIRIIGEGADEYDEQSHGGKEEQANGR